jgi:flagellar protein FlaG
MSISSAIEPIAAQAAVVNVVTGTQQPAAGATAGPQRAPAAAVPSRPADSAVRAAAAELDAFMRDSGRSIVFEVDQATGETVVSVRDASTGQSIRQIPSEEALRIARDLRQSRTLASLLLDAKA